MKPCQRAREMVDTGASRDCILSCLIEAAEHEPTPSEISAISKLADIAALALERDPVR